VERAASEFLRAIRGRRSQVAFARRLGYRGNPITDWERGVRFPTAAEALRAAARANIDVRGALSRFSPNVGVPRRGRELLLDRWLFELRGTTSVQELAARAGSTRFSVGRWLRGKAEPRLPDFLRLVDAITGRVPELVHAFVPIDEVPSLAARFHAAQTSRRLAYELPWTEAVLRLLETRPYAELARHEPGWIARRLGIDLAEEQRCLAALVAARSVELVHERYVVRAPITVDTQGGAEALQRLKAHWCSVASTRIPDATADDLFAYNVVSVSRSDLGAIREKLRATFRDVRSIVASSRPEETAAVINLHLITFDTRDG
jgi:transcriptional regulator with XRE-family HTH domain